MIKALGLSGSQISGKNLMSRLGAMEGAEIVDCLSGLVQMDYVNCDVERLRSVEDLQEANFSVNTAMLRDLRDALAPKKKEMRPTRQRRG